MIRRSLIALILLSAAASAPVIAQSSGDVTLRVGKLEKEMKAVQRKVFPQGVPVEPEIGPNDVAGGGVPSSTPVADLTQRVDALESQLKVLTGQVEQDSNRIRKLEEAVKLLQAPPAATPMVDPELPATPRPQPIAATAAPKPIAAKTQIAAPSAPAAKPGVATKIDPKRKSAVDAVVIPDTGDATEDAYTYGFRLWQAKLYPEAQVKLKEFVGKYPKHRRASYAQNLLGRAYLDEGKPALASVAFYENYTKNANGERASESLYYLGVALTRLNKLPDACKVYDEFADVYGAKASADLKAKVAQGRTNAKCTV